MKTKETPAEEKTSEFHYGVCNKCFRYGLLSMKDRVCVNSAMTNPADRRVKACKRRADRLAKRLERIG